MKPNFNKDNSPKKPFEQTYFEDTHDEKTLLQKELIIIQREQILLEQRIQVMKSFANDLPSFDPQYSMLLTTIKMDQIELDELATRKISLLKNLEQK
jgi:hypothetical protein